MRGNVRTAWQQLFDDAELGAGNYFFKALAAHDGRDLPFLFLETPFTTPAGECLDRFSLNTLYDTVRDIAGWYNQHAVKPGDFVCLYMKEGIAPFVHALAVNSLGCTPVLINSNLSADIAAAFAIRHRFNVFVHDEQTLACIGQTGDAAAPKVLDAGFYPGQTVDLAPPPAAWPAHRTDDDIVMVCHSSGTTGLPKAVMHSHRQFFACKRDRLFEFIECEDEKLVTALPSTHACGMSFLMNATLLQVPTFVLSSQTGEAVAEAIIKERPTVVLGFTQTYSSLASLNLPDDSFTTVRRFFCTADTAHAAHIRNALRLAPEARFIDMLGSSELGMVQIQNISTVDAIAPTRTIGKALSHSNCAVLDPRGEPLPDGEPGYLGIQSPTLTLGYYGQEYLTELSRLNGYWLTGDVAVRRTSGDFVHLDRIVDVVDGCLGLSAYTLLLEEHLMEANGVFDASVFGLARGPVREQAIIAVVQVKEGASVDADQLLEHLLDTYPLHGHAHALPRYAVCVAVLAQGRTPPEGATGKVLKRALRDTFWAWQREFDDGSRDMIASLCWNHQLDLSQVEPPRPRSLAEVIAVL